MSNDIKKVFVSGQNDRNQSERIAASGITPGMFVGVSASALAIAHAVDGAKIRGEIAIEKIDGTIDDAYIAGDSVIMITPQPGDVVNTVVAAGAAAIAVTDFVTVDEIGTIRVGVAGTDEVVGYPEVALDNSGSGTAARLLVKIK